jgi:hypothetical protein
MTLPLLASETITWVSVKRPTLDIVGLVLGALKLAGVLLAVAFVLGGMMGVLRILVARRRSQQNWQAYVRLGLSR